MAYVLSDKITAVLCLLFVTLGTVCATDCPDTWVAFEGSCYLFGIDTPLKFYEAEHYCRQHEGHLVHVNSAAENAFIKTFLHGLKPSFYWMGLTDERIEGVYKWYDTDEVATLTDWALGQPNNYKNQDCVIFYTSDYKYQWGDAPCDELNEPLCERRPADSAVIG